MECAELAPAFRPVRLPIHHPKFSNTDTPHSPKVGRVTPCPPPNANKISALPVPSILPLGIRPREASWSAAPCAAFRTARLPIHHPKFSNTDTPHSPKVGRVTPCPPPNANKISALPVPSILPFGIRPREASWSAAPCAAFRPVRHPLQPRTPNAHRAASHPQNAGFQPA